MEIVHADLRGSNVLVSNDKRALIADFGVSRISVTLATTTNLATNLAFWMAPELLLEDDPAKRKPTKASDIWALACTCFEIMTDSKPFEQQFEDRKPNAQNALIREFGKRAWFGPPESQGFPPVSGTEKALWEVFSGCWKYNSRPCIEDIADSVAQLSLADNRPSSGLDDTWQTVAKAARNPRPAVDYKKARSILSRAPGP
jgi:serine/threonine protein kinase